MSIRPGQASPQSRSGQMGRTKSGASHVESRFLTGKTPRGRKRVPILRKRTPHVWLCSSMKSATCKLYSSNERLRTRYLARAGEDSLPQLSPCPETWNHSLPSMALPWSACSSLACKHGRIWFHPHPHSHSRLSKCQPLRHHDPSMLYVL